MSELATAIQLLPTHLLRAFLAHNPPTLPVFEDVPTINKPNLRVLFRCFRQNDACGPCALDLTVLTRSSRLAEH